ncbi:MAG: hypothetical protein LBT46_00065 [Planctomycetaceae bacterium]|nr:hypothetical protein [Planctomycetaceae bacterium]
MTTPHNNEPPHWICLNVPRFLLLDAAPVAYREPLLFLFPLPPLCFMVGFTSGAISTDAGIAETNGSSLGFCFRPAAVKVVGIPVLSL